MLTLCKRWGLKFKYSFFILITTVYDDRSIRERVIVLAGEVNCTLSLSLLQKHVCRNPGRMGKLEGLRRTGILRVSSPVQDAELVAETQRNPFFSAKDTKADTGFPGQKKKWLFRDLRKQLSGYDNLR